MKEKNLPDDNDPKSLEELTMEIDGIIENLEKEKNLEKSIESYQKLIKLNNYIEKRFQKENKEISNLTKSKIDQIVNRKNEKKT